VAGLERMVVAHSTRRLSRPKDEVLDSLSKFLNALGTGDV
jgi:hypothetical protein